MTINQAVYKGKHTNSEINLLLYTNSRRAAILSPEFPRDFGEGEDLALYGIREGSLHGKLWTSLQLACLGRRMYAEHG